MAWTQNDLDELEKAIASGARSVSYDGKSVSYHSVDEMWKLRNRMRSALGLTIEKPTVLVAHDRGFGK